MGGRGAGSSKGSKGKKSSKGGGGGGGGGGPLPAEEVQSGTTSSDKGKKR